MAPCLLEIVEPIVVSREAKAPTFDDRTAMWETLDFPEHRWSHPAVDDYVDSLRVRYANGSVLFRSFQLPSHSVFDFYLLRNLRDSGFFERFWSAPTPSLFFRPANPDLNYFAAHGSLQVFAESSPFLLAGNLAWIHFAGGAYSQSKGLGTRSKHLGDVAAQEMIADDFESTLYFESGVCWSDFFMNVAWDSTTIVICPKRRLIHCLLATDTD